MARWSSLPELLRDRFHATVERLRSVHGRHAGDRCVADHFDGVNLATASHLIAGGYLLHGPAVAVRVGEEDEPDVVQVLPLSGRARSRGADHLDLADLHPALDKPDTSRADVIDHQLQALERAGGHVHDALSYYDRATRPRRGQLHDAELLADLGVVVDVEPQLLGVERFGAVHVRDGDHHHLERPVHDGPSFLVVDVFATINCSTSTPFVPSCVSPRSYRPSSPPATAS